MGEAGLAILFDGVVLAVLAAWAAEVRSHGDRDTAREPEVRLARPSAMGHGPGCAKRQADFLRRKRSQRRARPRRSTVGDGHGIVGTEPARTFARLDGGQ